MKIQVTADDIYRGKPCEVFHCPIARALERATGRAVYVNHVLFAVFDEKGLKSDEYLLPREAQQFIKHYDKNEAVDSFEFEVEVVL